MKSAGCWEDGSSIYGRVISFENLLASFYEFRRGKRHKEDIPDFEYNLEKYLFGLIRELKKFTYAPLASKVFKINEPKPRFIQAASVRDRVVHHALVRVINPLFEPGFIYDSYACRHGKGTLKAVRRLEEFWRRESRNYSRKIYFLKADIRKYFDSIDHSILIGMLRNKISCPRTIWLIKKILKRQPADCKGIKIEEGKGLPIGNLTSQLFANIYLNEFDQYVKHRLRVRFYIRYVDDFVAVSADREYLTSLIAPIENFLKERLRLALHPVKRKIFSSRSGIDFLGYFIRRHYKILRSGNVKRFLRRVDKYKREGKWEAKEQSSMAAWLGYAGQADSRNLIQKMRKLLARGRQGAANCLPAN